MCIFATFQFLAGLTAIAGIVANFFHLTRSPRDDRYDYIDISKRVFLVVFCLIIVAIELDISVLTKRLKLLDLWIFRGFFFFYIALCTADASDSSTSLTSPENLAAVVLGLVGILYVLMGILCLDLYKKRRYISRARYSTIPDTSV